MYGNINKATDGATWLLAISNLLLRGLKMVGVGIYLFYSFQIKLIWRLVKLIATVLLIRGLFGTL